MQRVSQNKIIESVDGNDKSLMMRDFVGVVLDYDVLGNMLVARRRLMLSKYVPTQEAVKMQNGKKLFKSKQFHNEIHQW